MLASAALILKIFQYPNFIRTGLLIDRACMQYTATIIIHVHTSAGIAIVLIMHMSGCTCTKGIEQC